MVWSVVLNSSSLSKTICSNGPAKSVAVAKNGHKTAGMSLCAVIPINLQNDIWKFKDVAMGNIKEEEIER